LILFDNPDCPLSLQMLPSMQLEVQGYKDKASVKKSGCWPAC